MGLIPHKDELLDKETVLKDRPITDVACELTLNSTSALIPCVIAI
jgi:hypothetical protein